MSLGSWVAGMILNELLKKTAFYPRISNLNFIKSETLNKAIGLDLFKWIVKNTFFKYFNQNLKLKKKVGVTDLIKLREEMTFAEISHLLAFGLVAILALYKAVNHSYIFGLIIMIMNVLLNLYPSLLQQQNKSRIDRFVKRMSKGTAKKEI